MNAEPITAIDFKAREIKQDHPLNGFRPLLDQLPQATLILNGDRIELANPAFLKLFHCKQEKQLLGLSAFQCVDEKSRDPLMAALLNTERKGHVAEISLRLKNASGALIEVEVIASKLTLVGHSFFHLNLRDIGDQRVTEQALRESEARFRDFSEVASDWFWEQDENLRFTYISDRHGDVTGLAAEEFLGRTRKEVAIARGMPITPQWQAHFDTLERQEPYKDLIYAFRRPDGELKIIRNSGKPVYDDEGRFRGYRGVGFDVTEETLARQRLIENGRALELANRAKSEFLGHMSHELRTPLNSVIGFSGFIDMKLTDIEFQERDSIREYLGYIQHSGEHLLRLINDLLDISRIEAGNVELEEDKLCLRALFNSAITLTKGRKEARGKALEVEIADDIQGLYADPRRLKQVLVNLVANAVRFTPDPGVIRLEANRLINGDLAIRVRDNGIGIAEQDLERVKQAFGMVKDPQIRHEEGTGLGLPLAISFIALHGGQLDIESAPGKGTTIHITLPGERLL